MLKGKQFTGKPLQIRILISFLKQNKTKPESITWILHSITAVLHSREFQSDLQISTDKKDVHFGNHIKTEY